VKTYLPPLFLLLVLASLPRVGYTQTRDANWRIGASYTRNFAAQINYNPSSPQNGKFQWNYLPADGFGIFAEKDYRNRRLTLAMGGTYQTKGYRETIQTAFIGIPESYREGTYGNRFRYLTVESNVKYNLVKDMLVIPSVFVGANVNRLLSYEMGSDVFPINTSRPFTQYGKFRDWSLGYNIGVGATFNQLLIIEGKLQKDLTPIHDENDLQVWNWVWSLNVKVNILGVLADIRRTD
jgi:hypothetical protein